MRGRPTDFWGKLHDHDGEILGWHPLVDHCADVASCTEALLRSTLLGRRLARLGGVDELDDSQIDRLCVLAALHDLGKFNQHFQNKGRPGAEPRAGHVREIMVLFASGARSPEKERLFRALPVAELATWGSRPDVAARLLFASIAHHGRPVPCEGNGISAHDPARWATVGGLDPFDAIARLVSVTRRWFPSAWAQNASALPATQAFAHAFSGLIMLADWIGSDRETFTFTEIPGDRMDFARLTAAKTVRALHLDPREDRAALGPRSPDFSDVTGRAQPHDAQARTIGLALPTGSSLTLLESETGSGKTEAAVLRFLKLFHAGVVDGMYFALPTRTAATQIHTRVQELIVRAFPDEARRPPVVLAVPGYLKVDDLHGTRTSMFEVLWKDDSDATQRHRDLRHRRWAAEHPKRFLASAIAIGTIDQALLSALTVDHAHLRATSLLRQLLVVDEVHASDPYMSTLLQAVLGFHLSAGGHALLMSATLGSSLRARLFGDALPSLPDAIATPYPLITHRHSGVHEVLAVEAPARVKSVHFDRRDVAGDPEAVAREALAHASRGARVLVIRNTVRDAVATQEALERIAAADNLSSYLFCCTDVVTLHHSRFARVDRTALDVAIELDFGHQSPSVGRVVIATQTVQQSLDLDADILLTDLCPMDVLLQRIGRLQRHRREGAQRRPDGYDRAVAVVLVPSERDMERYITPDGSARGPHGIGSVYDDLRVLHATWCQIEAHPSVEIPTMNRELVESSTHPEALRGVLQRTDRWNRHAVWCEGTGFGQRRAATLCLIARDESAKGLFGVTSFPEKSLGMRISTRLGEGDRFVRFASPFTGPFGQSVQELTVPTWMARDVPPEAVATVVEHLPERTVFAFGDKRFLYDRLGLRVAVEEPTPEEDHSDV